MRSIADRRARRETSAGATLLRPCDLIHFSRQARQANVPTTSHGSSSHRRPSPLSRVATTFFFAKALRDVNQHKLLSVLCLPARVFLAYREAALATVCGRCAIGTLNTQSNNQKSQRSPGERSRARRGAGRLFCSPLATN